MSLNDRPNPTRTKGFYRPSETPEKYCERCGVKLERKRWAGKNNKLEDLEMFKNRRYCSCECSRAAQRKE
jgi:hypothetical protein